MLTVTRKLSGNAKSFVTNPFEIKCGSHIYKVDEFYGENEGLIVAEIELSSETETLKDLFGWVKK
jgi:CYTH domain-containing protein